MPAPLLEWRFPETPEAQEVYEPLLNAIGEYGTSLAMNDLHTTTADTQDDVVTITFIKEPLGDKAPDSSDEAKVEALAGIEQHLDKETAQIARQYFQGTIPKNHDVTS